MELEAKLQRFEFAANDIFVLADEHGEFQVSESNGSPQATVDHEELDENPRIASQSMSG